MAFKARSRAPVCLGGIDASRAFHSPISAGAMLTQAALRQVASDQSIHPDFGHMMIDSCVGTTAVPEHTEEESDDQRHHGASRWKS
jgi:hypothetical protein